MVYSEQQLDTPISVEFIRRNGYCANGTRYYWKSLGLDFKQLLKQELTIRDLIPYQNDVFINKLINELLGTNNG